MVVGGSVARLPYDLENLEKSENLKSETDKNQKFDLENAQILPFSRF